MSDVDPGRVEKIDEFINKISGKNIAYSVKELGERIVLRVEGEVSFTNSDQMIDDIRRSILVPGWKALIIDLSQVLYIDSSGFGFLVQLLKTANAEKKSLILVIPQGSRMRAFMDTIRLNKLFRIVDNLSEAIDAPIQ